MKRKKRVVLTGAGGRANAYLMHGAKEGFDLVALADLNPVNRRTFLGFNSLLGMVAEYDCYNAMLEEHPEIDGAIIAMPNHLHIEPAVECLKRGIAIALGDADRGIRRKYDPAAGQAHRQGGSLQSGAILRRLCLKRLKQSYLT